MKARDQVAVDAELAREIIANARDYAIFWIDPDGKVASWNIGAERIKGYTAAEVLGSHFSRFYLREDIEAGKCEAELAAALRDGRFEEEGWRVRKDGTRFWANVILTPLFRDGELLGYSKITRDLTAPRRAEEDRLRLMQTQEAVRLRDEFLSIAAHELRTPLVALQLQIESVRAHPAMEERQAVRLRRASHNIQRLSDLITTLMDVTRLSTGRLTMSFKRVNLSQIVADTVDRLEESAHDASCAIVSSIEPGIVTEADGLRMGQVVTNLLANAFRHARGTTVDVTLARTDGEAVLVVADRGPGIPPDRLSRVFERFERGTASEARGGMGLGLYVAREVVQGHGGTIQAGERDGGGAVLEVRLPIRHT